MPKVKTGNKVRKFPYNDKGEEDAKDFAKKKGGKFVPNKKKGK